MALETLKDVKEIGGFKILRKAERPLKQDGSGVDWEKYDALKNVIPIAIDDDLNTISFKIQNGPIKEVGVNGCQVDTLIHAAKEIIGSLNAKFPCKENETCIYHLGKALQALEDRKKDRESRKVEGLNKK